MDSQALADANRSNVGCTLCREGVVASPRLAAIALLEAALRAHAQTQICPELEVVQVGEEECILRATKPLPPQTRVLSIPQTWTLSLRNLSNQPWVPKMGPLLKHIRSR